MARKPTLSAQSGASLAPVFLVRVVSAGLAPPPGQPVADDKKRRLLPPGTYRITANVVIEGELSLEQLRALFVPAPAGVAVRVEAQTETDGPSPEELERRRLLTERAAQLVHAYTEKLGEGPNYLSDSLEQWLGEFSEAELRAAMDETAAARGLTTKGARYSYLREVLRHLRRER